jgi:RimJ/RimL family protein N-acetyltransferase
MNTQLKFDTQPTLENDLLLLKPLKAEDLDNLFKAASDPLIWEQHPAKERSTKAGFELFFKEAMESKGAFIVIDKKSGEAIGSTRFYPVSESANAIEIGWTFLARQYWGSDYNKSMKKLMMDHAFQFVDNVLFYIHETNYRSQRAVEKIGGQRITHLDNTQLVPRSPSTVIYRIHKTMAPPPIPCCA